MFKFTNVQIKQLHELAVKSPNVQPFHNDNPAIQAKRIEMATGDDWESYKYFCKTYYPEVFSLPFCKAHKVMFETIESNVGGLTVLTGFRKLSKTVMFGPIYDIWKLIKGWQYCCLVSSNSDTAIERSESMYYILDGNIRIKTDYPEMKIISGDESDFYLKGKQRVRARSLAQFRRGSLNPKTMKRIDIVDIDDVDMEENIGNVTIGKRKRDKIMGAIFGSQDDPGKFIATWKGNLTHPNFAICQMEDELEDEIKSSDDKIKIKDLKHLVSGKKIMLRFPVENKKGDSIWPEMWSNEVLKEMKATIGTVTYLREMMGKKIIEGKVFKWEWFKRWNKLPSYKGCYARLYVDPAYGEKNCRKSYVGGFRFEKKYYCSHNRDRQEKDSSFFESFYRTFEEMKRKHGVRLKTKVEGNFSQCKRFCRDLDLWCQQNNRSSISHFIKPHYNKENKHERCESLETIIEQGLIIYPDGQDTKTIEEEFLSFPDGFLDGIDATEGWLQQFPGYNPRRGKARVRRV